MEPPTDDRRTRNESHLDRRAVLKALGSASVALGAAGSVPAVAAAPVDASTVVDLGEEGLQTGDNIDPYLKAHFTNDTEVRIPAGEYAYSGTGLGGSLRNCALIGSPEGVTFQRPAPETAVRPDIFAEAGTVRIENVTIRGQRGQTQSRWRVGAAEGARMEVVNVNLPDGTVDGSDSPGLYAGSDHGGDLLVKACYFEGFGNAACHLSDPFTGADGRVVVEDCVFRNTNGAGVRFAPTDSVCRGCYFEATEQAPTDADGTRTQVAIEVDDAGTGVVVEDCDFEWGAPGGPVIDFDERGQGGAGVVRNVRIRDASDSPPVTTGWDVSGSWTGENINYTEA
jgi:hypothetical protein